MEGRAYGNLGIAYGSQGDLSKAIEYHMAIAKEVGDRAEEGAAFGNLGIAFRNLGNFFKALKHHKEHLVMAKEVGDRAGEGRAYGNLGIAYRSQGLCEGHRAPHAAPGDCKGGGRPGGGGQGVREPRE